jgi:hypothetical protein
LVTRWPTVTATVWTGQVRDVLDEVLLELLLVVPPLPEVVLAELTMSGIEPKRRP